MAQASLIINPVAGGGQSIRRWQRLEPMLRRMGLDFDSALTGQRGDAVRLAANAVEAGCTLVVAVGGDGTVNEVVNGIMAATRGSPAAVRLGIIPTGRGVDLCRTVGVPLDHAEAAARLTNGRTIMLDVGELEYAGEGRSARCYFVNFVGLGFDVEVTRRANSVAPRGGGTLPYLSSVLLSLFSYKNKRVEIVLDGEVIRRRVNSVVVANGQYFGGGMRIVPQASPVDGLFDVVVLGDLSKLELIRNLPRVYEGTHITHPKVETWQAERVEVHSVEPVYLQADGDPLGETPARMHLLKGALPLLV